MRAQFHLYSAVLDDVGCNADLYISPTKRLSAINLLINLYSYIYTYILYLTSYLINTEKDS